MELAARSATDRRSRLICGLQPTLTPIRRFRSFRKGKLLAMKVARRS